MKKLKLYLDTSVISHLFADDTPDKMQDTLDFWEDVRAGRYEVVISSVVAKELGRNKEPKKTNLNNALNEIDYAMLEDREDVILLARAYIENGVLREKSFDDCLHIAFSVVYNCDILVSWNFKHLVNYNTIMGIKIVNAINHYKEMAIVSPNMLLREEN